MMIDYMGLLRRPFVVKVSYPGPDFAAGYDVHHPDYAGVLKEAGSSSDGSVVKLRIECPASLDMTRKYVECREPPPVSAWQLRATRKRRIPVRVVKDARTDITEIGETKYLVPKLVVGPAAVKL